MSVDAEDVMKRAECPICELVVEDYAPGVSSVTVDGLTYHPACAPTATIDDVLLAADTPEEIAEDLNGWNSTPDVEDEGFPVRQYTDEDIDQMLAEENAIVMANAEKRIEEITERRFPKPLTLDDERLIHLLNDRYTGMDAPFIRVETEDEVVLRVPPGVRRKSYDVPLSA